jgi:hypothetical protein
MSLLAAFAMFLGWPAHGGGQWAFSSTVVSKLSKPVSTRR